MRRRNFLGVWLAWSEVGAWDRACAGRAGLRLSLRRSSEWLPYRLPTKAPGPPPLAVEVDKRAVFWPLYLESGVEGFKRRRHGSRILGKRWKGQRIPR